MPKLDFGTHKIFPEDVKVLVFQGGGYEGCFWEWNAIYIDIVDQAEKGQPFKPKAVLREEQPDISGYRGKEVLKTFQEEGVAAGLRLTLESAWESLPESERDSFWRSDSEYGGFLIRNDADWEAFQRDMNEGIVRGVAKRIEAKIKCQRCERHQDPEDIHHDGYHGCGGLAIAMDGLFCTECMMDKHSEYADKEWKGMSYEQRMDALTNQNGWRDCSTAECIESFRYNQFEGDYVNYWSDADILKFMAASDLRFVEDHVFGDAFSY